MGTGGRGQQGQGLEDSRNGVGGQQGQGPEDSRLCRHKIPIAERLLPSPVPPALVLPLSERSAQRGAAERLGLRDGGALIPAGISPGRQGVVLVLGRAAHTALNAISRDITC